MPVVFWSVRTVIPTGVKEFRTAVKAIVEAALRILPHPSGLDGLDTSSQSCGCRRSVAAVWQEALEQRAEEAVARRAEEAVARRAPCMSPVCVKAAKPSWRLRRADKGF